MKDQTPGLDFSLLMVRMVQTEDKIVFAELYKYFAPRVKSFQLKLGCGETTAEEIAQESMVTLWRRRDQFDPGKASVSTWIFRISRNLRIDYLRKHKQIILNLDALPEQADKDSDPAKHLESKIKQRIVQQALAELPADQSDVLKMSFFEGKAHGDIAQKLNLPLGTVKSRIRLATERIRNSIRSLK